MSLKSTCFTSWRKVRKRVSSHLHISPLVQQGMLWLEWSEKCMGGKYRPLTNVCKKPFRVLRDDKTAAHLWNVHFEVFYCSYERKTHSLNVLMVTLLMLYVITCQLLDCLPPAGCIMCCLSPDDDFSVTQCSRSVSRSTAQCRANDQCVFWCGLQWLTQL